MNKNYADVLESMMIPAMEADTSVAPTLKGWSGAEVYYHGAIVMLFGKKEINLNDKAAEYWWFGNFCAMLKENNVNEMAFIKILKEHFTEMSGETTYVLGNVDEDKAMKIFDSMKMYRIASDGMGNDLLFSVKTKMFYEYIHDYGIFNPETVKGTPYKQMINSASSKVATEAVKVINDYEVINWMRDQLKVYKIDDKCKIVVDKSTGNWSIKTYVESNCQKELDKIVAEAKKKYRVSATIEKDDDKIYYDFIL